MGYLILGVKGGGASPLPRAGFNAPPAETSTPLKRSATWCASLLDIGILAFELNLRTRSGFGRRDDEMGDEK